jgi:hypothetical protein
MARHAGAPKRSRHPRGGRTARLGGGLHAEIFEGPPLGRGVTRADDRTLLRALERLDLDRGWRDTRRDIRPMLSRLRPYPPGVGEPIRVMLPPGILVAFGLDIGPALVQVTASLLETWGIDRDELVACALGNVRRLAGRCHPGLVVRSPIGETDVAALQTDEGIAASLLLVPDQLERFFGPQPGLLLAPMRDLLLRLPPDTDPLEAAWIANEFEAIDPNALHLGGFAWDGRLDVRPVPLEPAVAEA